MKQEVGCSGLHHRHMVSREFKKRELVPNPGVSEQGEEPGAMSAGVPRGRREPLSSLIHPGLHLTDEPALGAAGTLGPYQGGQGTSVRGSQRTPPGAE